MQETCRASVSQFDIGINAYFNRFRYLNRLLDRSECECHGILGTFSLHSVLKQCHKYMVHDETRFKNFLGGGGWGGGGIHAWAHPTMPLQLFLKKKIKLKKMVFD